MARILGLDITPHSVRGALVTTALRRTEVTQYVEVPLPEAPDPLGQAEALRQAVWSVIDAMGQRPPDGVVAELEGRDASIRVLELPAGAAKRVDEVLPFELEPLLPFPVDEAVIDHQVIARTADTLRVLATAVPKAKVGARLEVLRDAGVDPKELAVGAAALDGLPRVLPPLEEEGPVVVVDMGHEATDVCFLENGTSSLARTLSSGVATVRGGRRQDVESDLRRTMASYRAGGGTEPVAAYLAGDATAFPNAAEWLAQILGVTTHILPLPPVPGADDAHRPRFGRAVALAARTAGRAKRFDLRKGEFARRRAMGVLRQQVRLVAICMAVVLMSFAFSSYARWTVLEDERDALRTQLREVTRQLFDTEVSDPGQARELLTGGKKAQDPLPRFDAWSALEAISGAIPSEITHDTRRLHIDFDAESGEGRFELEGTVHEVKHRDTISGNLAEHECFQDLETPRTRTAPGGQGLSYTLEAAIRCPGAAAPPKRSKQRKKK